MQVALGTEVGSCRDSEVTKLRAALTDPRHVLISNAVMTQRLALVALSAILALAGVVSCPRGTMACAMVQKAAHDCCGHSTNLRSADCCCGGAHQTSVQATGAASQDSGFSVSFAPMMVHSPVVTRASTACKGSALSHGPAPPNTPITQHTQLLL